MTKSETSELFGYMALRWPNAKIYQMSRNELAQTIAVWQRNLADFDYWLVLQALSNLEKVMAFQPDVSEVRKEAERLRSEYERNARFHWQMLRTFGKEEYLRTFSGCIAVLVVKKLNGTSNWRVFCESYFAELKSQATFPALAEGKKKLKS